MELHIRLYVISREWHPISYAPVLQQLWHNQIGSTPVATTRHIRNEKKTQSAYLVAEIKPTFSGLMVLKPLNSIRLAIKEPYKIFPNSNNNITSIICSQLKQRDQWLQSIYSYFIQAYLMQLLFQLTTGATIREILPFSH